MKKFSFLIFWILVISGQFLAAAAQPGVDVAAVDRGRILQAANAAQGAAYQLTGDEACLAEARRQFKDVFVPDQMAADGSFPAELKRTKPYAYSIFQPDNRRICVRPAAMEHRGVVGHLTDPHVRPLFLKIP